MLLGRPVLYGLALGGAQGVQQVLELLRGEFELAMALCGCVRVRDIGPRLLLQQAGSGLVPADGDGGGDAGVDGTPACALRRSRL